MIPLHDDNPTVLTPVITVGLIAACALIFLWQVSLPPGAGEQAVYAFGMIPAVLFGERVRQRASSHVASLARKIRLDPYLGFSVTHTRGGDPKTR